MNKVLSSLIVSAMLAVSAPAFAQENNFSFLARERFETESYIADAGLTRAQNTPGIESLYLVDWSRGRTSLTFDFWNVEAINPDTAAVRRAVHENDYELELTQRDIRPGLNLRVKAALYEIDGGDITSVRVALDHRLSDECDGTASFEQMWGAFDFGVTKVSAMCSHTWGDWTGDIDVGLAYNTLNKQFVVPVRARVMWSNDHISIGPYLRGYAAEDGDDWGAGLEVALRR